MEKYMWNYLKNYMVGEGIKKYGSRAMWSSFYLGLFRMDSALV